MDNKGKHASVRITWVSELASSQSKRHERDNDQTIKLQKEVSVKRVSTLITLNVISPRANRSATGKNNFLIEVNRFLEND